MNFSIIRNELLEKINRVIFTQEDIEIYLLDLLNNLELKDYLSEIDFDNIDNNILATYNFNNKKIKISRENIIRDAKIIYPFPTDNNLVLFINLSIIEAILHEVVHIFQNYLLETKDFSLLNLYELELMAAGEMMDSDYNTYYNCFIFEREAIVTSLENILIIIKHFIKNDELFEYYFEELQHYLVLEYTLYKPIVTSPIEKLFDNYFKEITPTVSNLDLYDTLKLGFQITNDDFTSYFNNYRRLILDKNNLQ